MERVTSHRRLTHGVIISVKDHNGEVVTAGEIIGFPYNSSLRSGSNREPDMVQVRMGNRQEKDMLLSDLGIGPHARPDRHTYIA